MHAQVEANRCGLELGAKGEATGRAAAGPIAHNAAKLAFYEVEPCPNAHNAIQPVGARDAQAILVAVQGVGQCPVGVPDLHRSEIEVLQVQRPGPPVLPDHDHGRVQGQLLRNGRAR